MNTTEYISQAAYADGYGDAVLEVGSGAPPASIWDVRFESLIEQFPNADASAVMSIYCRRYDDGWMDGAHDENRDREAQARMVRP